MEVPIVKELTVSDVIPRDRKQWSISETKSESIIRIVHNNAYRGRKDRLVFEKSFGHEAFPSWELHSRTVNKGDSLSRLLYRTGIKRSNILPLLLWIEYLKNTLNLPDLIFSRTQ